MDAVGKVVCVRCRHPMPPFLVGSDGVCYECTIEAAAPDVEPKPRLSGMLIMPVLTADQRALYLANERVRMEREKQSS